MIPISYNIRSLFVRKTATIATVIGIALVVWVLSSAMMLVSGLKKTLSSAGRADYAIVLRQGADAELGSGVEDSQVSLVKAMPGVKQGKNGPIAQGEVVLVIALEKLGANGVANVQLRGVQPDVAELRPELKFVAGRAPRPGTDEVAIGRRIRGRFKGLELDQTFELKKNRQAKVVGVFELGGSAFESEVWGDVEVVRAAFGRQGAVSAVRVALESPTRFDGFKAAVEQDKRLGLRAHNEVAFYEKQGEGTGAFIGFLGTVVSVFFAVGAMIGAAITMYSSIINRRREIGILRALGFNRLQVLVAFVIEAVALALLGGALGSLASLGMGTVTFTMMNFATWSEIVFTFQPTLLTAAIGMLFAGVMGLVGGFVPAVRAAFIPPLAAMRA